MTDDERWRRMEEKLEQIHRTVVTIENVHGEKLQALADGLATTNEQLGLTNEQLAGTNERLDRIEVDVRDVKRGPVGLSER